MSGSLFLGGPQGGEAPGLLVPGNINLSRRPQVPTLRGIATVRSINFVDQQGREVLVPTVIGGRVVSNADAMAHYYRTGEHLGVFADRPSAELYAQALHEQQAAGLGARYPGPRQPGASEFTDALMKSRGLE